MIVCWFRFFPAVRSKILVRSFFSIIAVFVFTSSLRVVAQDEFEQEPILYSKTKAQDAVQKLRAKLEDGSWKPKRWPAKTFLREVLRAFDVPEESQVLVFSKTSQQIRRIAPETPRAMYFSDDCYIGWVRGGAIEIACVDPVLGTTFYIFDGREAEKPLEFKRDAACLSCHGGGRTGRIPGLMVRSVFTDGRGFPILSAGSFQTTHRSPLSERWGGWYVTGQHGIARHMGNALSERDPKSGGRDAVFDAEAGANLETLDELASMEPYLKPSSDIVALMVLEHQVGMHNALVRASFRSRQAIHRRRAFLEAVGDPVTDELEGSARRIVEAEVENVVEEMLFFEEATLPSGMKGAKGFQEQFLRRAKRTKSGRSLRELRLRGRLFERRCSFLIHSVVFDGMPDLVRGRVYRRLWDILSAKEVPEKYAYLDDDERREIIEILRETKKGLPAYWRAE